MNMKQKHDEMEHCLPWLLAVIATWLPQQSMEDVALLSNIHFLGRGVVRQSAVH